MKLLLRAMMLAALPLAGAHAVQGSAPPVDEVEEVQVRAQRLYEMRASLVQAQDRYYALYNQLNDDDRYDVICQVQRRAGSMFNQRVCIPKELESIYNTPIVTQYTGPFQDVAPGSPPQLDGIDPNGLHRVIVDSRRIWREYLATMAAVLNGHPQLRTLVNEHALLQVHYKQQRKERMTGRLVLFEK